MVDKIAYGSHVSPDHSRFKRLDGDSLDYTPSLGDKRRADRDTIDLSEGGQKVINLARATELGAKLPDADTNPTEFSVALKRACEDIERITRLFSEVLTLLRVGNTK